MAHRYKGDICFSNGEYVDKVTGETKKKWVKAGVAYENEANGQISFELFALPSRMHEWSGFMRLFEKEKEEKESDNTGKNSEAWQAAKEKFSKNNQVEQGNDPFDF